MPIPGTKQVRYLEENAYAVNVKLSEEEQRQLEATTAEVPVVGQRYTPEGMKGVNS